MDVEVPDRVVYQLGKSIRLQGSLLGRDLTYICRVLIEQHDASLAYGFSRTLLTQSIHTKCAVHS